MDIGIARSLEALGHHILRFALGTLCLTYVGVAVAAPDPVVPPLSAACQAPAADISVAAPLPNLAAKLKTGGSVRVMAIGSSSTEGMGASSPSRSYPSQLETILEHTFKGLNVTIINRGVSGEVASVTAERMRTQVALEKPDMVLWQVGTNDALERVPVEAFTATLRQTLGWLRRHRIDIALVGLQYTLGVAKDEHYAAIRGALREVAATENVLFVRRFEAMRFIEAANQAPLTSGDGLHPNDLGYRCMAEHIAHAVVVSTFLRPTGQALRP